MNYPDSDVKVWGPNIRYNLNDYAYVGLIPHFDVEALYKSKTFS